MGRSDNIIDLYDDGSADEIRTFPTTRSGVLQKVAAKGGRMPLKSPWALRNRVGLRRDQSGTAQPEYVQTITDL